MHHINAVRDHQNLRQVGGDDQNRIALLGQAVDQTVDLIPGAYVNPPGWLVKDQDIRLRKQPLGGADIFLDLLDAGFQRQLLFSLDATRTRLKCFHPQAVGLDYLLNVFLPLLRSRGVSQEQLALISHHNFVSAFHA